MLFILRRRISLMSGRSRWTGKVFDTARFDTHIYACINEVRHDVRTLYCVKTKHNEYYTFCCSFFFTRLEQSAGAGTGHDEVYFACVYNTVIAEFRKNDKKLINITRRVSVKLKDAPPSIYIYNMCVERRYHYLL